VTVPFRRTFVRTAAACARVVAVIGEHAVLLTDLRNRARPFLVELSRRGLSAAQQAAAESEMYKQLLDRMVDERLEQQAAEKSHITVTSEEIDAGIRNVASQQHLTADDLLAEAVRQGLTVQEYRDEIRRQILEGKLLQLRVKGRIRITDDDVKSTYGRLARAERKRLGYHVAWIVLHAAPTLSPDARADLDRLAESIAETARAGHDAKGRPVTFASLARTFSDDGSTRDSGGDLGSHKPGELAAALEDEIVKLDVGGVSQPFTYKDAIVIVKVLERDPSQIPPLAEVHDEVAQRVYGEQMDKARRQWLDELRRSMYVDVRL
jgi:peptidyl-prolyl cis-trans isomerase SurA